MKTRRVNPYYQVDILPRITHPTYQVGVVSVSLKSKSSELNHMFIVEKDIIKEVGREILRCKDPDSGFEEGGVKEVVGGASVS